ncbi:MAG: type II toxin-antitoxin system RelE/ParE family toxin [Candidatus Omnitrophota bacterium]|jgi:phage-related protein|nr:MAG: type II toxin-antitoxin system RelE/ParE family toxin [Candidatus Omnitrophota bacterium]
MSRNTKRIVSWIKPAWKDFQSFPHSVQIEIRTALTVVAEGKKPDLAKALKGFGSGVFEIALRDRTGAYRVVYALQIGEEIWGLHAFQKKSKFGIRTPKPDIELIRERIKRVRERLKK